MAKNTALAAYKAGEKAKKSGKHHKNKFTLPLAVVAGFIPVGVGIWNRRNSPGEIGSYLQAGFTGIGADGRFNAGNLRQGAIPVMAGFFVHMIASKLGINRAIARAGIPLIRI